MTHVRHIHEKNFADTEMMPLMGDMELSSKSFREPKIFIELSDLEACASIREETFKDSAMSFMHQTKAEFDTKETVISAAGLVPTILTELSRNIPGLGAVICSISLREDIAHLRGIQTHIQDVSEILKNDFDIQTSTKATEFTHQTTHEQILGNTFLFILAQLERRVNKTQQIMVGKTLQIAGSTLTALGLVTHGVTAVPGLIIGFAGTAIKLRITLRSASNFFKKKYNKELSINRELHARYLYGLTLKYLINHRSNLPNFSNSREAVKAIKLVESIPGEHTQLEPIAADFVSSIAHLKDMDHFIEHGFWTILAGIKT
ncbi:MAG: hypothetical protein WCK42_06700 [Myxococcaceae bacterium]